MVLCARWPSSQRPLALRLLAAAIVAPGCAFDWQDAYAERFGHQPAAGAPSYGSGGVSGLSGGLEAGGEREPVAGRNSGQSPVGSDGGPSVGSAGVLSVLGAGKGGGDSEPLVGGRAGNSQGSAGLLNGVAGGSPNVPITGDANGHSGANALAGMAGTVTTPVYDRAGNGGGGVDSGGGSTQGGSHGGDTVVPSGGTVGTGGDVTVGGGGEGRAGSGGAGVGSGGAAVGRGGVCSNLVSNPGFEAHTNELPDNWLRLSPPSSSRGYFAADSTVSLSGSRSLKIDTTAVKKPPNDYVFVVGTTNAWGIKAGDVLQLAAAGSVTSLNPIQVKIVYYDSMGQIMDWGAAPYLLFETSTDFVPKGPLECVAPDGAATARVAIIAGSGVVANIDDVSACR